MNKELKKYIKKNLNQVNKRFSIRQFIRSPFKWISSLLSKENEKSISNTKDIGISKNISSHNIKRALFKEEFISGSDAELTNNICKCSEEYDIDDFIKNNNVQSNFQTTLFKMIDERNKTDSDVYNKVHIDRRLFSKIRNDNNYHPSKETIILLGLSLELNELEIENLLNSASYSLPKNNYYDLIIRFCFMKGIYKITDVNNLLDQYNCKLFNY